MISLRHPPREVLLEVSVPKEDTVHKEQRHLSPALWGNTVEPKEIRNLMTALPVWEVHDVVLECRTKQTS